MTYRTHSDTRQAGYWPPDRVACGVSVCACVHARSRVRYRNGMLTGGLMWPVVQSDGIETNWTERKENEKWIRKLWIWLAYLMACPRPNKENSARLLELVALVVNGIWTQVLSVSASQNPAQAGSFFRMMRNCIVQRSAILARWWPHWPKGANCCRCIPATETRRLPLTLRQRSGWSCPDMRIGTMERDCRFWRPPLVMWWPPRRNRTFQIACNVFSINRPRQLPRFCLWRQGLDCRPLGFPACGATGYVTLLSIAMRVRYRLRFLQSDDR